MDYRRLVDLDAIAALDSIPKRTRKRLLDHLVRLRATPDSLPDYHEEEHIGRRVEISVYTGYSIHYWIDFPERHSKIWLSCLQPDKSAMPKPAMLRTLILRS